jgi:hypothetical protein
MKTGSVVNFWVPRVVLKESSGEETVVEKKVVPSSRLGVLEFRPLLFKINWLTFVLFHRLFTLGFFFFFLFDWKT